MRLVYFVWVLCAALFPTTLRGSPAGRAEILDLIKRLRNSPVSLDVSGFRRSTERSFTARTEKSVVERVVVPEPKDTYDAFSYKIYLDETRREFWIFQNGGIAGVSEWYGPAKAAPRPMAGR